MNKPTLILIPGLVCDRAVWEKQIEAFSAQYHIIIPDLSTAKTPEAMVAAVLMSAPESFAMAGHSMGGWVALEVMRASQERVSKLALLNTTAASDTKEKAQARLDLIALYHAGERDVIVQRLLNAYLHQTHCEDAVARMILRNLSALVNQEEAMLVRQESVSILPQITCPTLIISSNQDKIFNQQDANQLANGIAHSTLICLEGCGHTSPLEVPEAVTYHMAHWLSN